MCSRGRSGHSVRVRANFNTLLLKLQYLQSFEYYPSVELLGRQRGRKSVFIVVVFQSS